MCIGVCTESNLRKEVEVDLGCIKCPTLTRKTLVCILFAANSQHWFLLGMSAIFPQPCHMLQGRNARME